MESRVLLDIGKQCRNALGVLSQHPKRAVAVAAEQRSDTSCRVMMVEIQRLLALWLITTRGAASFLTFQQRRVHLFVFLQRQVILAQRVAVLRAALVMWCHHLFTVFPLRFSRFFISVASALCRHVLRAFSGILRLRSVARRCFTGLRMIGVRIASLPCNQEFALVGALLVSGHSDTSRLEYITTQDCEQTEWQ